MATINVSLSLEHIENVLDEPQRRVAPNNTRGRGLEKRLAEINER